MKDEPNALGTYTQARDVMRVLLVSLLADSSEEANRLTAPALMLHAGLLLSVADPVEPGRLRGEAVAPMRSNRGAGGGRGRRPGTEPRSTAGCDQDGRERAEEIVAYVRKNFSGDHRATYNLACFEARLAGRDERWRGPLLERARVDLADAVHDRELAEWAPRDPALRVLELAGYVTRRSGPRRQRATPQPASA